MIATCLGYKENEPTAFACHPNGDYVVGYANGGMAWYGKKGNCVSHWSMAEDGIRSIKFNFTSDKMAVCSFDGFVHLVHHEIHDGANHLYIREDPCNMMQWANRSNSFVLGCTARVYVYTTQGPPTFFINTADFGSVMDIRWSDNDELLFLLFGNLFMIVDVLQQTLIGLVDNVGKKSFTSLSLDPISRNIRTTSGSVNSIHCTQTAYYLHEIYPVAKLIVWSTDGKYKALVGFGKDVVIEGYGIRKRRRLPSRIRYAEWKPNTYVLWCICENQERIQVVPIFVEQIAALSYIMQDFDGDLAYTRKLYNLLHGV